MSSPSGRLRFSSSIKISKELISEPYNFSHVGGVRQGSPEQFLLEEVNDFETLKKVLRSGRPSFSRSTECIRTSGSFDGFEDEEGLEFSSPDSGAEDCSMASSRTFGSDATGFSRASSNAGLLVRRRAHVRKLWDNALQKRRSLQIDHIGLSSHTGLSSPDIELNDSSFFESLLTDRGSPIPDSDYDEYHHRIRQPFRPIAEHPRGSVESGDEEDEVDGTMVYCPKPMRQRFASVPALGPFSWSPR